MTLQGIHRPHRLRDGNVGAFRLGAQFLMHPMVFSVSEPRCMPCRCGAGVLKAVLSDIKGGLQRLMEEFRGYLVSQISAATRRAKETTIEVVAEEMAVKAENGPVFTAKVIEAGGASFAVVVVVAQVFTETTEVIEIIIRETRNRAGGDRKSLEEHGLPAE